MLSWLEDKAARIVWFEFEVREAMATTSKEDIVDTEFAIRKWMVNMSKEDLLTALKEQGIKASEIQTMSVWIKLEYAFEYYSYRLF